MRLLSPTSMRRVRFAIFATCLFIASSASASPNFPQEIVDELDLAEPPPPGPGCRICHASDQGGPKTIATPFGRAIQRFGAIPGSGKALRAALSAAEQEGSDVDGDGFGDIAELRAGTNPNAPDAVDGEEPPPPLEQIPLPQTGCSFSRAPGAHWGWVALAVAFVSRVRRRRA